MGYPLWGQDIDAATTPLEAGLGWAIDWEGEFVGKRALEQSQPTRRRIGVVLEAPGIPRHEAPVMANGKQVGAITSGAFSPHLGAGIGQAYVDLAAGLKAGDTVEVEVRNRPTPAHLARFPFVKGHAKPNWMKVKGPRGGGGETPPKDPF